MAIFRPGVRQGALAAMRQGQLGQFLGAHPQAGAAYNQAFQRGGGRANQIATMNAGPPGMTRQQARLSLGQAAGGRPMPMAGRMAGPVGLIGGGGSPAPPTMQQIPPGAQYRGPQMSTLGGMSPFSGGRSPFMPQFPQGGQVSGGYGFHPAIQGLMGSVNPGMQSVLGSRLGQMGYPLTGMGLG